MRKRASAPLAVCSHHVSALDPGHQLARGDVRQGRHLAQVTGLKPGAAPVQCSLVNLSVTGALVESARRLEFAMIAQPGNYQVDVKMRAFIQESQCQARFRSGRDLHLRRTVRRSRAQPLRPDAKHDVRSADRRPPENRLAMAGRAPFSQDEKKPGQGPVFLLLRVASAI